jgi:hypothetical protein
LVLHGIACGACVPTNDSVARACSLSAIIVFRCRLNASQPQCTPSAVAFMVFTMPIYLMACAVAWYCLCHHRQITLQDKSVHSLCENIGQRPHNTVGSTSVQLASRSVFPWCMCSFSRHCLPCTQIGRHRFVHGPFHMGRWIYPIGVLSTFWCEAPACCGMLCFLHAA